MKQKMKIDFREIILIFISVVVLSWITYNQFELAKAKSRDVDRKSSLNELGQAIRLYYADYGVLPSEELINGLWGKEWRDGEYVYLKKMPKENSLDKEYCYLRGKEDKNFSLLADLEYKSDVECQKDKWSCGGQNYCYNHALESEMPK
jgi:hypothetical protein